MSDTSVGGVVDVERLDVRPRPIRQDGPRLPMELARRGVAGRVLIEYIVDTEGRVRDIRVLESSARAFERPAIEMVEKWEFMPGKLGGREVATRMTLPVFFGSHTSVLPTDFWQIGKSPNHDELPEQFRWDEPPTPISSVFPVFPFEQLVNRERVRFRMVMIVNPNGEVDGVLFDEEPPHEFAHAARAMAYWWWFEPAKKDGEPCYAAVGIDLDFHPRGQGTVPVGDWERGILRELSRRQPRIYVEEELDRSPTPLGNRPPSHPPVLREQGIEGEALIEFFIDRNGDARLPRIISSTREEFGYYAAQAIAAWRFMPPRKDGRPVIARVRVPVRFPIEDR